MVQAQIAGLKAGASPDAYAGTFRDIALRRQGLEACRRTLLVAAAPRRVIPTADREAAQAAVSRAMGQAWRVLSDEAVPGVEKRDLLATIVERVVCRKEGADVVFLPGVFGTLGEENQSQSTTISTLYTTCIVIQFRSGIFSYEKREWAI